MPADFKSQVFVTLLDAWLFIKFLAPFVVTGIVLAALLNTFVPHDAPAKLLKIKKWWMLPVSGLAGLVSPACTYGTVPLFMEMIKRGAPMAPAATFLVASALVNPQMFWITTGALGIWVAVAQAAASLVFSVAVGVVVARLARRGIDIRNAELAEAAEAVHDETTQHDASCGSRSHHHHKHASLEAMPWYRRLGANLLDLTEFIGFYFVLGSLIAAAAAHFIPQSIVISAVGQGKWWAIPLATVVSIPTYICGGGSIPFVAQARAMGMDMGAVLAFLIAGPATRVTALSALAVLFKKRVLLVYVVLLLVFASVLGFILGQFVPSTRSILPYGQI